MGEQVLGGGVIVLVCVLLWLVYLLPSWASRHRYDASERNAVRINQALRILAETSETPQELRIELNTRAAYEQQKLARRAQAEREELERRAQAERLATAKRAQAEREELERLAQLEHEAARVEVARRDLAAARANPAARRSHARRRARLVTTIFAAVAIALVASGGWLLAATAGAPVGHALLWPGLVVAALATLLLRRMASVGAARPQAVELADVVHAPVALQDVALASEQRAWAPRSLPRPLTASAGSRAAAVLDAEEAREALRQAALEEAIRDRAAAQRPTSIDAARRVREQAPAARLSPAGAASDAEIEAHVRDLLMRRASGQ